MMRVLEINSCINGSTGGIMKSLQNYIVKMGGQCITSSRLDNSKRFMAPKNHIYVGNAISKHIDNQLSYLTGREGKYTRIYTKLFLKKIDKYKPDIIHIHNLHANYINLEMLFDYMKKNSNIRVVWTLHDCWSFTGHCPHFEMQNCDKWKSGCCFCNIYRDYPASRIDNSNYMYNEKKRIFTGVENLVIVTPSEWLGQLVKQSFLSNYPVKVINNGIKTDLFYRRFSNTLQKKYNIADDKTVILGVASGWEERKGLNVFNALSKELPEEFVIVLVGINDKIRDKISPKIISIDRTENQEELAEIYSESDVFVNPTLEENYPTVNIEAICCGTPVFTYNTGGSGEIIKPGCGKVVEKGNYGQLKNEIINYNRKDWDRELISKNREYFSEWRMAKAYYDLYLNLLDN